MGPPRQRLTRIAGYRIGGDQSGGTGTILQTCHELASFQLVELHLIRTSQGCSAAWPHAAVRHHRAQSQRTRIVSGLSPVRAPPATALFFTITLQTTKPPKLSH